LKAEQEGLAGLSVQGSSGRAAREFTFHCREDTFDQEAFPILFCWKVLAHLQAHSGCAATGAAFGRHDTLSLELLAAEGVVGFGIELGVGTNIPLVLQSASGAIQFP
jgi:hypothetical protein